jgi:hypothetical protein
MIDSHPHLCGKLGLLHPNISERLTERMIYDDITDKYTLNWVSATYIVNEN